MKKLDEESLILLRRLLEERFFRRGDTSLL